MAAATAVREEEAKDHSKSEAKLAHEVDTLERAISIIQREMSKNPAFLQKKIDTRTVNNVISALTTVMLLSPLFQSRQASDEDDSEFSALVAASVSRRSDMVDVLNDLLDKAEAQEDEIRHANSDVDRSSSLCRTSWLRTTKLSKRRRLDRVQYLFGSRESKS